MHLLIHCRFLFIFQRRVSILTSTLRETNKRMDEMASSLTTKKHQGEQSSDLIHSTISELQEFTQKVSDVEKNLEALECKFLKIEQQVRNSYPIKRKNSYSVLLSLKTGQSLEVLEFRSSHLCDTGAMQHCSTN